MTYEHQEKLEKKRHEAKNLRKLRGKIYNDSSTFNEYQVSCAVNGIHHKRVFDRFWYFYLCRNYGNSTFNIVVSLAACSLMSVVIVIAMHAIGMSFTPIGLIVIGAVVNIPTGLAACFLFNAMNRKTYHDYL